MLYLGLPEVPDSELICKNKRRDLPKGHWRMGCEYTTNLIDRFMCPFVEGSCIKIPRTMENPDPEYLEKRISKHNKAARLMEAYGHENNSGDKENPAGAGGP